MEEQLEYRRQQVEDLLVRAIVAEAKSIRLKELVTWYFECLWLSLHLSIAGSFDYRSIDAHHEIIKTHEAIEIELRKEIMP